MIGFYLTVFLHGAVNAMLAPSISEWSSIFLNFL